MSRYSFFFAELFVSRSNGFEMASWNNNPESFWGANQNYNKNTGGYNGYNNSHPQEPNASSGYQQEQYQSQEQWASSAHSPTYGTYGFVGKLIPVPHDHDNYNDKHQQLPDPNGPDGHQHFPSFSHYRDLPSLIVFITHIAGLLGLLSWLVYVDHVRTLPIPGNNGSFVPLDNSTVPYGPFIHFPMHLIESVGMSSLLSPSLLSETAIMAATAFLASVGFLQLVKRFPRAMVITGMVVTELCILALTIFYFASRMYQCIICSYT